MEKITRHLTRKRDNGFIQTFPFTTYDIIFDSKKWPEDEKAQSLMRYLQTAFLAGFKGCSKSPSGMPELVGLKTRKVVDSEFVTMARKANYRGAGLRQHERVEQYFLRNHPDCIAIEAPTNDGDVEGCIDILLMQSDPFKISILDFKPFAAKEKKAPTQLYYYLKALSIQTQIHTNYFDLFYFDDQDCFKVTNPEMIK
jgi:hypothetical protein